MKFNNHLDDKIKEAVKYFWETRLHQIEAQKNRGKSDQGNRGSVTGGAHMDGFTQLLLSLIENYTHIDKSCLFNNKSGDLPGFFRASKQWDIIIRNEDSLIAAIEVKSHIGSFGNNFNNRTEEAMGSALDLWTAFREGVFGTQPPWVGYLLLLEDHQQTHNIIKPRALQFPIRPEFINTSYCQRYELFLRKLMLERHYTNTAFLTSSIETGELGIYNEPSSDLTIEHFCQSLLAHINGY